MNNKEAKKALKRIEKIEKELEELYLLAGMDTTGFKKYTVDSYEAILKAKSDLKQVYGL